MQRVINICGAVSYDGAEVRHQIAAPMVERCTEDLHDAETRWWTADGAAFTATSYREPGAAGGPVVVGDLVCVADARIDNHDHIASALSTATGIAHDAATLIAHAYLRWGRACVDHLLGDYAFVVWDTAARRLYAARDAMGARTLFYRSVDRRHTIVATEARQLLAVPSVPRAPNPTALVADIAGLYALPSMTAFEGIDQLAPGCALQVDASGARSWRWYRIDPGRRVRLADQRSYAERLRELLASSVRARIGQERPTGMFLSGGIDGSAVAATAAQVTDSDLGLRAYSWAFDEYDDDERETSRLVGAACDIPVTDVPADDLWPLRDHANRPPDIDDPYTWLYQRLVDRTVSAAHDDGVGVMLTSDRGDEMTGNWVRDDLGLLLAGRVKPFVADVRHSTQRDGLRSYVRQQLVRPALRTAWPPHALPGLRRMLEHRTGRRQGPRPAPWVTDDAVRRYGLLDVMAEADARAPIRDHARRERHASVFHLVSLRVAQLRRRSYARYGLTYADPWGDRRIAEFVCAVPQWRVQRPSRPKMLTRQAMRGVVPESARRHPARSAPVGLFRRAFNDREVSTVYALLDDSRAAAAGWLDPDAVRASYESYRRGEDQAHDFWHPLCVEMWLRAWWD